MKTALRFVLSSCCFSSIALSSCLSPIALPVTNVMLSNQQSTRGVFATVGNPPQNISFMPNSYLNDSWIYNSTAPLCSKGITSAQCLSERGGLYDPDASNSSKRNLNVYETVADPSDVARALGTHIWFNSWATDDFTLANTTLHDYPIGLPGFDFGGYDTQANMGFGQNSSLLNTLKEQGLIQSRTYSFWYGIDSATSSASLDGQIVFGGYDAAKVIGNGFTQPLLPPSATCPSGMAINIVQLELNFPNASNVNLVGSNSIAACVQLNYPTIFAIPYSPYYETFMSLTETSSWGNSDGIYSSTPTYPTDDVFNGDLTISLQNGLSIQIPNDALVLPDQVFGPSGEVVYNATSSVVLIDTLENIDANDEPLIGRVFFSSTYLMVDLDAKTYTLWPVNVTSASRLVASGGSCSSPAELTSASPTSKSDVTPVNDRSSHDSSARTIAGAVLGTLFGVAFIIAAVIFWTRRRLTSMQETTKDTALPASEVTHPHNGDEYVQCYHIYYEVSGDRPKHQELDTVRPMHELEGPVTGHER